MATCQLQFIVSAVTSTTTSRYRRRIRCIFLQVLDKYLLKDSEKFVDTTFERLKKELQAEISKQSNDAGKKKAYAKMATDLRTKFGYEQVDVETE